MDTSMMIRVLQFIVLGFGVKEMLNGMEFLRQGKKKWAAASWCVGIFALGCAIISLTGVL